MENHASMLDRQAVSIMKLRTDAAEAVSQTQEGLAQISENATKHNQAIEILKQAAESQHAQLDTSLRGHVVEEVTRINGRIDALGAAAATAGTTAALEVRLQQITGDLKRLEESIDTGMRKMEEHVNGSLAALGEQIQAEKTEVVGCSAVSGQRWPR